MTYGVGLRLNRGLVFMSDTRTNAGLDDISTYRKMFNWCVPGDRTITMLTAGNLATTQAVVGLLNERVKAPEDRNPSILEAETMFQVAQLVGTTLREVVALQQGEGQNATSTFNATVIVGGQIGSMEPRMFMVYPEGNFIETSRDTQFLQIGETKYGRPILVRAYDPEMTFEEAVKLLIVSFDSTIKANLSVGMPLDVMVYETDSLTTGIERRIEIADPYFAKVSQGWGHALRDAFEVLPDFSFD